MFTHEVRAYSRGSTLSTALGVQSSSTRRYLASFARVLEDETHAIVNYGVSDTVHVLTIYNQQPTMVEIGTTVP